VIAVRWGMLLVAVLLMSSAFGATAPDLQPSAQRVAVTTIVGLLAPLFWPGVAASVKRTAMRITGWSAAASCVAAIVIRVLGHPGQPLSGLLGTCAMLMCILILAHTMAAALEARWRVPSGRADDARETAGCSVMLVLALLGALPLWFGPVSELLSVQHEWAIDAALGLSPLTHLAVASGNDLLHNEWLYQHANLAALPVSYPDPIQLVWFYVTVCSMLALGAFAPARRRRASNDPAHPDLTKEKPR
jgi:hypothetical protein